MLSAQDQQNTENTDQKERMQPPTPEQMIKIQSAQMAQQLMLDDATAAKFTTVYESFLKELNECREADRPQQAPAPGKGKAGKNAQGEKPAAPAPEAGPTPDVEAAPGPMCFGPEKELTDTEVAEMLQKQFEQSRKVLDIREKYYKEFSKILTQKQILKIYQQEKRQPGKFRPNFDRRQAQKPGQGLKPRQGQKQGQKQA